jgi:flagellar motor protein MotB
MRISHYRIANLVFLGLIVGLFPGCTNWKEKYEVRDAEYKNVKSLLVQEMARRPQTIEKLRQQILELKQSPGEASGFGEDYDVVFDPSAGTLKVTLKGAGLFAPGEAVLKKTVYPDLTHIANVLKSKYSSAQVAVVGHTDSDPIRKTPWKDNWELSAHRAFSVLRYLTNKGVAKDQIWAVARGASQPVASNLTANGKAQNRRVEIIVYLSE